MITEEQRLARKTGIFSSDVPRVMMGDGVRVYLEKTGDLAPAEIGEMEYVQLGNLLEGAALQAYAVKTGKVLRFAPDTLRHERHQWLGAHLDAIDAQEGAVIEAKSVGIYNRRMWGEPGTDEIPDRVLWQVQAQLAVTGLEVAYIPVVFGTEENLTKFITTRVVGVDVYVVPRSETLIEHLIMQSDMVWSAVQARIPPKPVTVQDARLLYTQDTGEAIQASEEIVGKVTARSVVERHISDFEHEKAELDAEIMAYMREASDLRWQGKTIVTWRKPKDSMVLDKDELKKQMPGIYEQFTVARPGSRRFLVR